MQDELIRKLPFSMPAEQSLLGSVLIDPAALNEVADLLNAEATGELENNLVDMATEMRFRKAGGWS